MTISDVEMLMFLRQGLDKGVSGKHGWPTGVRFCIFVCVYVCVCGGRGINAYAELKKKKKN